MAEKIFALILLLLYCWRGDGFVSRQKRQKLYAPPIVYPFGGTFKLIVGFAVPVKLSGRILVYGQNFQFQYALPQNATFFTEFFEDASSSRRRREGVSRHERMTVYRLLEEGLERREIDGRECVKKAICEAAMAPMEDEGLVGELLHLLFTPQRNADDSSMDTEYLQASEYGRLNHDCSEIYRSCSPGQGILDRVSKNLVLNIQQGKNRSELLVNYHPVNSEYKVLTRSNETCLIRIKKYPGSEIPIDCDEQIADVNARNACNPKIKERICRRLKL